MVASGIYGPKVWHVRLAADNSSWLNYIGSTWDKFLAWAMADGVLATAYQSLFQTDPASFVQKWAYTEWDRMDLALAALTVTVFVSLLPDSVSRVYKTISDRRPAQSRRVASHDQAHTYTFGAALSQLLSLPLYLFGIWTWASAPASRLLADDGSSQVFVAFLLAITFVFGRMATKIILAHLLLSPFPTPTILFVPLLGGALLANLGSLLTSLAGAYAIYPLPGATDFQEWTTTFSKTWLTTFANTRRAGVHLGVRGVCGHPLLSLGVQRCPRHLPAPGHPLFSLFRPCKWWMWWLFRSPQGPARKRNVSP